MFSLSHSPQFSNLLAFYFNVLIAYGIGAQSSTWAEKLSLKSNKQISEKYPTLVTPAGYAFAIWGIIFSLEAISVCWMFTLSDKETNTEHLHGRIPFIFSEGSRLWILTCQLQCAWTLAFAWDQMFISTGLMIALMYAAISTYITNLFALETQLTIADAPSESYAYFWAVLPFALHASWLIVATLVQLNIFVVSWNASSNVQVSFALLSLAVLLLMGCYVAGTLLASIGYARTLNDISEMQIGCRMCFLAVLLWSARAIESFDGELARVTAGLNKKEDDNAEGKETKKTKNVVELIPLSRLQTIIVQRFKGVVFRCLFGAFVGNVVLFSVKRYQLME
jgi:hypothetical protein